MLSMPGRSHAGPLPPLAPEEAELRGRLERHVRALAGDIGERNTERPQALEASARYLEQALRDAGYAPAAQPFEAGGVTVRNIDAVRPGGTRAGESLVVGAHYDTVPGSPGANDNTTGVAAVLEIARRLAGRSPARTVRFAFFVNEEPPFFQSDLMGSVVYARACRGRGDKLAGMISLETIGCYADAEGSQRYPFPFSLLYPRTGNFIGFVGNLRSRRLVRRTVGAFRRHAPFPSEGLVAPGWITELGWSDHWAFWQEGWPALMVTDTAPFRYAHYHTPEDTPDRIDYERFARVTAGLVRVVEELAGEP
jgi:Zn-dependent M28 family amino/carboxypeptidase